MFINDFFVSPAILIRDFFVILPPISSLRF